MTYNTCRIQAIEDLKNYNYLKSSLAILPKRIETMQNCIPHSRTDPSEACSASNTVADAAIAQIEYLQSTLSANSAKVYCIETALDTLPARDRELLKSYYINRQRNSLTSLAHKSYSDRSSIYRRAQRALEKYILAFFGETPA